MGWVTLSSLLSGLPIQLSNCCIKEFLIHSSYSVKKMEKIVHWSNNQGSKYLRRQNRVIRALLRDLHDKSFSVVTNPEIDLSPIYHLIDLSPRERAGSYGCCVYVPNSLGMVMANAIMNKCPNCESFIRLKISASTLTNSPLDLVSSGPVNHSFRFDLLLESPSLSNSRVVVPISHSLRIWETHVFGSRSNTQHSIPSKREISSKRWNSRQAKGHVGFPATKISNKLILNFQNGMIKIYHLVQGTQTWPDQMYRKTFVRVFFGTSTLDINKILLTQFESLMEERNQHTFK